MVWMLRPVERRSEEHTSEPQSPCNLVCRLLLEKNPMVVRRPLLRRLRPLTHGRRHQTRLVGPNLPRTPLNACRGDVALATVCVNTKDSLHRTRRADVYRLF